MNKDFAAEIERIHPDDRDDVLTAYVCLSGLDVDSVSCLVNECRRYELSLRDIAERYQNEMRFHYGEPEGKLFDIASDLVLEKINRDFEQVTGISDFFAREYHGAIEFRTTEENKETLVNLLNQDPDLCLKLQSPTVTALFDTYGQIMQETVMQQNKRHIHR